MDPADLRKRTSSHGKVPVQIRARMGVRQRQLSGRTEEGDRKIGSELRKEQDEKRKRAS